MWEKLVQAVSSMLRELKREWQEMLHAIKKSWSKMVLKIHMLKY